MDRGNLLTMWFAMVPHQRESKNQLSFIYPKVGIRECLSSVLGEHAFNWMSYFVGIRLRSEFVIPLSELRDKSSTALMKSLLFPRDPKIAWADRMADRMFSAGAYSRGTFARFRTGEVRRLLNTYYLADYKSCRWDWARETQDDHRMTHLPAIYRERDIRG